MSISGAGHREGNTKLFAWIDSLPDVTPFAILMWGILIFGMMLLVW